MFIGRREDGTIYGTWTVQQFKGQEELSDNDPAVVEFTQPKPQAQIAVKLVAAVEALQKEQLTKRAAEPDAPQAVKDYAAAVAAEPASAEVDAIKPKG